jgi:transposase
LPVVERNYRHPGRRGLEDRKVLCGILFVLYTGIPWRFLPQELGFGSGMTCWRRLRDWNDAGVWQRLHELLLAELRAVGMLDFSRAAVGSAHLRAMKGGPATGPSPVDRGKTGSKHHLIVEAHGIPLATILTGGNRNDVIQLLPLLEAADPGQTRPAAPTPRPPLRRPRLRPRALPRPSPRAADHPAHRPAQHRARLRPTDQTQGTMASRSAGQTTT